MGNGGCNRLGRANGRRQCSFENMKLCGMILPNTYWYILRVTYYCATAHALFDQIESSHRPYHCSVNYCTFARRCSCSFLTGSFFILQAPVPGFASILTPIPATEEAKNIIPESPAENTKGKTNERLPTLAKLANVSAFASADQYYLLFNPLASKRFSVCTYVHGMYVPPSLVHTSARYVLE